MLPECTPLITVLCSVPALDLSQFNQPDELMVPVQVLTATSGICSQLRFVVITIPYCSVEISVVLYML